MTFYSAASRHISHFAVSSLCCTKCRSGCAFSVVCDKQQQNDNHRTTVGSGTCTATFTYCSSRLNAFMKQGRQVHWVEVLDVPKESNAHILKVERSNKKANATLHPWRRRDYVPSKRWDQPTHRHSVVSQTNPPQQRTCENIKSRIHQSICMCFVPKFFGFQTKATGTIA